MDEMAENDTFRFYKQSPEGVPPNKRDAIVVSAIKQLQEIERSYQGAKEVEFRTGDSPIYLIEVGDLHLGSIASDHDAIYELRDLVLSEPNIGLVLLGDEIEGLKPQYLDTNTARTPIDVQTQIDVFRSSFLEPLAKEKKILAMVSGYWGHPGWVQDATTVNPWIAMTKDLGIPILLNGGKLRIKFANGHEHPKTIWHNPPGHSEFDSVLGLRKVAQVQSENKDRSSGYSSGHTHQSGVAKENYPGAKFGVYYISSGTTKGSNPDLPLDRFGIKLGRPPTDPIGQGEIIMPRRTGKKYDRTYPVISFKHGEVLNEALKLLDRTEQQGITEELTEKILKKAPKPEIQFIARSSTTNRKPYDELAKHKIKDVKTPKREDLVAQYDNLFYNIQSSLPVTLHLIANARLGASYEGYGPLKDFLSNYVVENPYALTIFLRNMIDSDVTKDPKRDRAIEKYIKIMNLNGKETLAFILDENLRKDAWKREVSKSGDSSEPIAVATHISKQTGARVIHDLSTVKVALGPGTNPANKPVYTGKFADKLFHHGSFNRATYGLRRIYDLYSAVKPGYVAGGHMPNSGSMAFFDRGNPETNNPILLAPGWWASYIDSAGQGNVSPGAVPGQAMVFMPGTKPSDYLAFPTTNPDETNYVPAGLTLLTGLKLIGLEPKDVK